MELYLLDVTLRGTVATLVALALERLFVKQLTAGVRRCMWLAVMALFLIGVPFHRPVVGVKFAPAPAFHVERRAELPAVPVAVARAAEPLILPAAAAPAPWWSRALETIKAVSWREWLLGAWMLGFAFALARLPLCWLWLARRVGRMPDIRDQELLALLDDCRRGMPGGSGNVRLVDGGERCAPALFGFFKPVVILPLGRLARLSQGQRRFILLHELCHAAHRDTLWSVFGYVPLAAQWFNPFCHLAYRRFRSALETSADKRVMELSGGRSLDYGDALLETLDMETSPLMPAIGIAEDKNELKRRIMMISRFKKQKAFAVAALATFIAASLVAVVGGVGAESKPLNKAPQDNPGTAKPRNASENMIFKKFLFNKSEIVCAPKAFEDARGKIALAPVNPGDFLIGSGFLPGHAPRLESDWGVKLFAYVVATLDAKPVAGGLGRRLVCAFPFRASGDRFWQPLPSEAFEALFQRTGEYELSIKATLFGVSGEGLTALTLADEVDGSKGVAILYRQFNLPVGGEPDWPLLNTLREKYPQMGLSRDYGLIKVVDKIPAGFFKAVSPSPETTAKIVAGLNVTYDADGWLCIHYQGLPCGVLAQGEFQVKGESQWREWMDIVMPAATGECSAGTTVEPPLQAGQRRLRFRLTPLAGNKLWIRNTSDTIKNYYGGVVETGWFALDIPRLPKRHGFVSSDTVFQEEAASVDTAAFEKVAAKFYSVGPFDYLRGRGFRGVGVGLSSSYYEKSPLLYVLANFAVTGPDGEREIRVALPWPAEGRMLSVPSKLFEAAFAKPGDYRLKATYDVFNLPASTLIDEHLALAANGYLSFPEDAVSAERTKELIAKLGAQYPHRQIMGSAHSLKVFDKIPANYFKLIPASLELEAKIKAGIGAKLVVASSGRTFLEISYKDMPCNIFARVEYQFDSDGQWLELGKNATFAVLGADVAKARGGGGNGSCSNSVLLPPYTTTAVKLKFIPFTTPEDIWGRSFWFREFYGGAVETDWLKLDVVPHPSE